MKLVIPMRAMRARQTFAAALILSSVALSQVVAVHAAGGVPLRFHYKVGQKTAYVLTSHITGSVSGLQSTIDMAETLPYTQQVTKVYADGSALLTDTFGSATVTTNGQTQTVPMQSASSTQRVTADGKVLSVASTGLQTSFGDVNIDPSAGIPSLPTTPVSVGSRWTAKQSFSLGTFGAISGAQHYTVVALGPVNGHTVATIVSAGKLPVKLALSGTQITGNAVTSATSLFDADAGALISTRGTVKITASLGAAGVAGQGAAAGQTGGVTLNLQLGLVRQP